MPQLYIGQTVYSKQNIWHIQHPEKFKIALCGVKLDYALPAQGVVLRARGHERLCERCSKIWSRIGGGRSLPVHRVYDLVREEVNDGR